MPAEDVPPEQVPVSKNVIDRRTAASHGVTAIIAMLLAFFGFRLTAPPDPDRDLVGTTSAALDRAQDYWLRIIGPSRWRDARVVLLDARISTPCGPADDASGPFYCPPDHRIYLDLSFLRAIKGELARRYVIAHEVGHHVQEILREPDRASVDVELEADCYAGAWIADEYSKGRITDGDVEGALEEAASVGDDRVCPECSPEFYDHGTAAQRVAAVRRGIAGGDCR